jgi:hypothetical protein
MLSFDLPAEEEDAIEYFQGPLAMPEMKLFSVGLEKRVNVDWDARCRRFKQSCSSLFGIRQNIWFENTVM